MRQSLLAGIRTMVAVVLVVGAVGAAVGLIHGIGVASANAYGEQFPRLARWVVIEGASSGLGNGLMAGLAVLAVFLVLWPVNWLVWRDWNRAVHGAVLAVPTLIVYLVTMWWVNRHLLPHALSALSIAGNIVLAVAAAVLWYSVTRAAQQGRLQRMLRPMQVFAAAPTVLALLLALAIVLPLTRMVAKPVAGIEDPSFLLIVIDALRADHLGTYGHDRDTSPNLDKLAREAWQFQHAYSTAPWTKPSIASILTGLYPREHGVESAQWNVGQGQDVTLVSALPHSLLTFPELLADGGYRTAAIGQNHHLVAELGFDQGFELYNLEIADRGAIESVARKLHIGVGRKAARQSEGQNSAARINAQFLRWLPSDHDRSFAYLHHIDVHWPYRARPDYAGRFGPRRTSVDFNSQEFYAKYGPERTPSGTPSPIDAAVLGDMADAYDEGIYHVDAELGKLFAELRRRGRYDDMLIIVTADHGEQFMEHGDIGHGTSLHDELLHVPLIVKFPCPGPQCGPRRVDEPVQLVDLMPTILEAAQIRVPPAAAGRALTASAQPERVLFAEKGQQVALRTRQFKFIYNLDGSGAELYALESDPGEKANIAATEPALAQTLRDRLFQWIEETDSKAAAPREQVRADDAMLEKLKSLGYLK